MSTLPEIKKTAKDAMHKAIEHVQRELASVRSGKATPSLLDTVRVDAYGNQMPLNQVASVSAPEARLLTVQPWDKGLIGPIEKAIQSAGLGLNPANDGSIIRVPLPALNEERRRELVKLVKKLAEEGKISIRHTRTDAIHQVKDVEHVSDDDKGRIEKEIHQLHEEAIKELDGMVARKEEEIMEV